MIYIATILYWTYGLFRRIQDSFEFDLEEITLWYEPKEKVLSKKQKQELWKILSNG